MHQGWGEQKHGLPENLHFFFVYVFYVDVSSSFIDISRFGRESCFTFALPVMYDKPDSNSIGQQIDVSVNLFKAGIHERFSWTLFQLPISVLHRQLFWLMQSYLIKKLDFLNPHFLEFHSVQKLWARLQTIIKLNTFEVMAWMSHYIPQKETDTFSVEHVCKNKHGLLYNTDH